MGLFALLAAVDGHWAVSFAWLGAALFVDAVDGPLARLAEVKKVLPRFSGEDLDKVIDYLTYVTVPAIMIARSDILTGELRLPAAAVMMLVSLYHFSDRESKTEDSYFVGFPAIWNVIVFYCFVLGLPQPVSAGLIVLCALLTFIPFRWVHPLRVRRLRPVTGAVSLIWAVTSVLVLLYGFPGNAVERVIFVLTATYMVWLGSGARTGRIR